MTPALGRFLFSITLHTRKMTMICLLTRSHGELDFQRSLRQGRSSQTSGGFLAEQTPSFYDLMGPNSNTVASWINTEAALV